VGVWPSLNTGASGILLVFSARGRSSAEVVVGEAVRLAGVRSSTKSFTGRAALCAATVADVPW
jgi:hypothetical protein